MIDEPQQNPYQPSSNDVSLDATHRPSTLIVVVIVILSILAGVATLFFSCFGLGAGAFDFGFGSDAAAAPAIFRFIFVGCAFLSVFVGFRFGRMLYRGEANYQKKRHEKVATVKELTDYTKTDEQ